MKLQIFVIRDVQADVGQLPMYREKEEIAVRDFEIACCKPEVFGENPDDYVLYHIGSYDDEKMAGEFHDPRRVITGLDAVRNRETKLRKLQSLREEINNIEVE